MEGINNGIKGLGKEVGAKHRSSGKEPSSSPCNRQEKERGKLEEKRRKKKEKIFVQVSFLRRSRRPSWPCPLRRNESAVGSSSLSALKSLLPLQSPHFFSSFSEVGQSNYVPRGEERAASKPLFQSQCTLSPRSRWCLEGTRPSAFGQAVPAGHCVLLLEWKQNREAYYGPLLLGPAD